MAESYAIWVDVQCPYCSNVNGMYYQPGKDHKMQIVLCDIENSDGCDRYFVAEIAIKAEVSAYAIDKEQ